MSEPPAFCPHCGFNLKRDVPLYLGDWELHPQVVLFRGRMLKMTPQQAEMVYIIAKAKGRVVSKEVIASRLDIPGDPQIHVNTLLCRVRKHPERVPIETVARHGLRWGGPLP